jgi:hypothetical protein
VERPAGVTIIAILGFIVGGLAAILGLWMLVGGALMSTMAHRHAGMMLGMTGTFAGVVLLGIAALVIVTSIGLLKLQEWARILTVVLNAVHLMIAALGLLDAFRNIHIPFFVGVMLRHIVMLAIGVWIIVYLIQPKVKHAFAAKPSPAA